MTEIRIIRYSNDSGNREGVYFTEDLELDAQDVTPGGCDNIVDTIIEVFNWDSCFPMDYNLERR